MRTLVCILTLFALAVKAQLGLYINGSNASLRVDSSGYISVHGDFQNLNCDPVNKVRFNGTLYLEGSFINNDSLIFSAAAGTGNSKKARIVFRNSGTYMLSGAALIGGSVTPTFWEVELNKSIGNSMVLYNNVRCKDTMTFKNGLLYMNGRKWTMVDPVGAPSVLNHPYIKNERQGSQFMAASLNDTGKVIYKTIYSAGTYLNPANIGLQLSGPLNPGSTLEIHRGFKPMINAGKTGLLRYFDLYSPGHPLSSNTVSIRYTYNDMTHFAPGYVNLSKCNLFVSANTDMNWSQLPSTYINTLVGLPASPNGLMTASLSDLNLPNINVNDRSLRLTIADSECPSPPVSALPADTLHLCVGVTATIDAGNQASVSNTNLRWEWNTNPLNYVRTITVTPNTSFQKFIVCLQDVKGCLTRDSITIASQAPYPQITYMNVLNSCFGDSVTIKDTVTISSGTYSNQWLFSDSTSSITQQFFFRKKFSSTGIHAVKLIATSDHGCSVSATSTNITVYPPPSAGFSYSTDCLTHVTMFTNTSASNHTAHIVSSSLWNLGAGPTNTLTSAHASHTYSSSGTYSVKLKVATSFGCKDSTELPVIIQPSNLAGFTKNNSCVNDTVYLNNTSACNTGTCSYLWDLGDATQSASSQIKKTYSSSGLYLVRLKVISPVGCPDSVAVPVFVNANPVAQFIASQSTVCINNAVYFGNTSSISSGSIISFNWNYGNTGTSNSINGVLSPTLSGIFSVSLTAVSDSGCVSTYSTPISVQAQPSAQYAVNNVCFGYPSTFVSNSAGNNLSYVWDFGNNVFTNTVTNGVQFYNYSTPGVFLTKLIVIDTWGCSDTSSVPAMVLFSPTAALGGSISTCGNSYTLNAGNPGSGFFWQPGNQISQSVIAVNSGTYHVVVTASNGCVASETVSLTLKSAVNPHLGADTTVCGFIRLNAGYPGSTYLWNNSATSQSILVDSSGLYAVTITDQNNCTGTDSIQIIVNPLPVLMLGNDLSVCTPKEGFILTATTSAGSYLWSNGQNTPTINIPAGGSYWLEVTGFNNCKARDTINISFLNSPLVNLGPDKTQCVSILLDAQNAGCAYLWNDGNSEQVLNVNQSGAYWVTVTNTLTGCSERDTVICNVFPMINLFLGNDTSVCNTNRFVLDAKNPGEVYLWSTGVTSQTLLVSGSAIYGVTVTNNGGCSTSDYVHVKVLAAPVVELGTDVRYLCGKKPLELNSKHEGFVRWYSENGLISQTYSVIAAMPGKYWIDVGESGCKGSDTILVVPTDKLIHAMFLASTIDTINKAVQFVNLSEPNPLSQKWYFGDGLTSTEFSPQHTYVLPHDFSVTLEVSNGYCEDKVTKQLSVLFKNNNGLDPASQLQLEVLTLKVFPNPTSQVVHLYMELNDLANISISLKDISGRLVKTVIFQNTGSIAIPVTLTDVANGLYTLTIRAESLKGYRETFVKLVKTE